MDCYMRNLKTRMAAPTKGYGLSNYFGQGIYLFYNRHSNTTATTNILLQDIP
jgi:hypothetical protein